MEKADSSGHGLGRGHGLGLGLQPHIVQSIALAFEHCVFACLRLFSAWRYLAMNIATDTHGIIYLIDVPASVSVRSCGQSSMSLRNAYTQTRNVQTQTQSTVTRLIARPTTTIYTVVS